jgi:hypothetical protein
MDVHVSLLRVLRCVSDVHKSTHTRIPTHRCAQHNQKRAHKYLVSICYSRTEHFHTKAKTLMFCNKFTFFFVVKGPAADATVAPQP